MIRAGVPGACGVRTVTGDGLVTLADGHLIAQAIDPIEKKPLYHVQPGARTYSYSICGCNLDCPWCQNHEISQIKKRPDLIRLPGEFVSPAELVQRAQDAGCHWLVATYTEPTVFFEYAFEAARLAKQAGLKNAWVTNGVIEEAPLAEIIPVLDAVNVDLKCLDEPAAEKQMGYQSRWVLRTLDRLARAGVHVEVTTLVVPGINDAPEQLKLIAGELARLPRVPVWHVSRYHPDYRYSEPPVSADRIADALILGKAAGLNHVYAGNVRLPAGGQTRCAGCDALLIVRDGYRIETNRVTREGTCPDCGEAISGIW